MEFKIELPIKIKDVIYTIDNCKIEKYYVKSIDFRQIERPLDDISQFIDVELERYNDGQNSYTTTRRLAYCFLKKEDLIAQLNN